MYISLVKNWHFHWTCTVNRDTDRLKILRNILYRNSMLSLYERCAERLLTLVRMHAMIITVFEHYAMKLLTFNLEAMIAAESKSHDRTFACLLVHAHVQSGGNDHKRQQAS